MIVNDIVRVEDCERIAESLRNALKTPSGSRLTAGISGSVGYAMFPNEAADKDELYALADRHMYADKRAGATAKTPRVLETPLAVAGTGAR